MSAPRHEPKRAKPPQKRQRRTPVQVVPDSPRRRWGVITVIASILATAMLFGLVGFQALIVRTQSTLDDLDAQISSADRENQRLRLEVAELESPERIRLVALSILGMVQPLEIDYLEPISAEELGTPLVGDP